MPSFTHPVGENAPKPPPGAPINPLPAEQASSGEKPVALDKGGARADLPHATTEFIALDRIHPSPFNPRKDFSKEGIQELADSIRERGLQQNLSVRPHPAKPGHYELMGGERRWRALQLLKAEGAMCKLSEATDAESIANQLVENLQRKDVAPLEEANGFAALQDQDEKKWTAAAIAREIGKTDTFVRQRLDIARNLAPTLKAKFALGEMTVEQARTFATFPAQIQSAAPDWMIQRSGSEIRQRLLELCVPESAAKFDKTLYTGAWITDGKERRFFADIAQFMKLQRSAAEKKLAEVQKDWPKARIIDEAETAKLHWGDETWPSNDGIGSNYNRRENDEPKRYAVPKEKCTAVVWIAANGDIRKALGVCSSAAVNEAAKKRDSSRSNSTRSPVDEKPDHKKARKAFNADVAAAAAKKADLTPRLQLLRRIGFEGLDSDLVKSLPASLKDFNYNRWNQKEKDRAAIWRAIAALPMGEVTGTLAKLALADVPTWHDYHWNQKPLLLLAVAETLGITPPLIVMPAPKPPKSKAEKSQPSAKVKKAGAKKKHQ